jgi:hypothetical protein
LPPELERDVLLHAILMALTRYVPLPFLDDALRQAAAERMVRRLAAAYQRELSDAELKDLTEDRSGCFGGCLWSLLTFPFKKILARALVLWDLNRTLEKASQYFVLGYLVHEVFALGLYNGQARRVRDAVEEAAAKVGTSPVKLVFRSVLGGAGKKLREAGMLLARKLRRDPPAPEQERAVATQVLDEVEAEERKTLNPTLDRILEGLQGIPASYYEQLREALREALKRQSDELGRDALL